MLQQWIAEQQMKRQIASMGGMPSVPSGIDDASQQMPGAPSIESLMASPPSLMDMMGGSQAPQQAPAGLLDTLGAPPIAFDGRQMQSLEPPPMAMMASQAPTPAGLPSFRNPPTPAMMSPELAAKRKAPPAEYTIKKGDTLTAIARKFGTTVAAIMAKNPSIKNANKIYAGRSLII